MTHACHVNVTHPQSQCFPAVVSALAFLAAGCIASFVKYTKLTDWLGHFCLGHFCLGIVLSEAYGAVVSL